MQKIIISDTSCLILLDKIGELSILHALFGEVIITSVISNEFGEKLPRWIKIVDPKNKNYQNILIASVDEGEASAIALAVEQKDCLLILDDQKARKLAARLGLKFTGTLVLLLDAKRLGYIKSIKSVLIKIKKTNFRLSSEIEKKILEMSKE